MGKEEMMGDANQQDIFLLILCVSIMFWHGHGFYVFYFWREINPIFPP